MLDAEGRGEAGVAVDEDDLDRVRSLFHAFGIQVPDEPLVLGDVGRRRVHLRHVADRRISEGLAVEGDAHGVPRRPVGHLDVELQGPVADVVVQEQREGRSRPR